VAKDFDEPFVDEGEACNEEEVYSAKEVFQYLTKTSKTLKIYLPNNRIHQKFISELAEKMQSHLEKFGTLRIRVKRFELYCSDIPIYENSDRFLRQF